MPFRQPMPVDSELAFVQFHVSTVCQLSAKALLILSSQAASGWRSDGGDALLLPRPPDGGLVAAAAEAQRLLLAGRRADALRCAALMPHTSFV